jgi:hypothetical protein
VGKAARVKKSNSDKDWKREDITPFAPRALPRFDAKSDFDSKMVHVQPRLNLGGHAGLRRRARGQKI